MRASAAAAGPNPALGEELPPKAALALRKTNRRVHASAEVV